MIPKSVETRIQVFENRFPDICPQRPIRIKLEALQLLHFFENQKQETEETFMSIKEKICKQACGHSYKQKHLSQGSNSWTGFLGAKNVNKGF